MKRYYQLCLRKERTFFYEKIENLSKMIILILFFVTEFFFSISLYSQKTVILNQRNISLIYGQRHKFLRIKESFVDSIHFSLMQTNLFLWIEEFFFELTKLSLIQRNFFFDRISKKYFFLQRICFLSVSIS